LTNSYAHVPLGKELQGFTVPTKHCWVDLIGFIYSCWAAVMFALAVFLALFATTAFGRFYKSIHKLLQH
jgi:hypothetical protein